MKVIFLKHAKERCNLKQIASFKKWCAFWPEYVFIFFESNSVLTLSLQKVPNKYYLFDSNTKLKMVDLWRGSMCVYIYVHIYIYTHIIYIYTLYILYIYIRTINQNISGGILFYTILHQLTYLGGPVGCDAWPTLTVSHGPWAPCEPALVSSSTALQSHGPAMGLRGPTVSYGWVMSLLW